MTPENLEFIFHHLFLPPKLPQESETKEDTKNLALLRFLCDSIVRYQSHVNTTADTEPKIRAVRRMLDALQRLKMCGHMAAEFIEKELHDMKPDDVLAMHIEAQNAGIILRYVGSSMVFESFEVSQTNHAITTTTGAGRLRCAYPGPVITIEASTAQDERFISELSPFLAQMDSEAQPKAVPITVKSNSEVEEIQDTASPMFITELLFGILRGLGQPVENVERIQKRVRDEVLWSSARLPWRRSPLWHFIKVALQTTLGYDEYKNLMIFILSEALHTASQATRHEVSSDMLYVMNAKISRRVYKATNYKLHSFVNQHSLDVINTAASLLQSRWSRAQEAQVKSANWNPNKLDFERDTVLSLENSHPYIQGILDRSIPLPKDIQPFDPGHCPRKFNSALLDDMKVPKFTTEKDLENYLLLFDFEYWVAKHLADWTKRNMQNHTACSYLAGIIDAYALAAGAVYFRSPAQISTMLLTVAEIWVALDKIVVEVHPLMKEYAPEIPVSFFEALILPKYRELERLHAIELWLQERHSKAFVRKPILSTEPTALSLQVRYFDSSAAHKSLECRVLQAAQTKRDSKMLELKQRLNEYNRLIKQVNSLEHQYVRDRYTGCNNHDRYCSKCSLSHQAENMTIELDEWSLPDCEVRRKFVVFEMDVPIAIASWRDATYNILNDVCRLDSKRTEGPLYLLGRDSLLLNFLPALKAPKRLVAASTDKPFTVSHYRSIRVSTASVSSVCVNNGLRYKLYDSGRQEWVDPDASGASSSLRKLCSYKLPSGPYQCLQYAVNWSDHTHNKVIAEQSKCPSEVSLHEYDSFGKLRAGTRIQWLNIVRELRCRTMDFSNEAVAILLLQASLQAGPSGQVEGVYRQSHFHLQDFEFREAVLGEIESLWDSIENNWREAVCARVLIALTSRVLSLSTDQTEAKRCYNLLRRGRQVMMKWIRSLSQSLQEATEEVMQDLRHRLLTVALICRTTYDVDTKEHQMGVLSLAEDISMVIECAIIVHDNTPATLPASGSTLELLDLDRRLSHKLEQFLASQVERNNQIFLEGLHDGISRVWPAYVKGGKWTVLSSPNQRWIKTFTGSTAKDFESLDVHLNFLDGQLLVNGEPLGRLPHSFTTNYTFKRVFGQRVLDVNPSSMPGMRFQTCKPYFGYELHFTLKNSDLVLRAHDHLKNVTYELVPHKTLVGDLPTLLVEDYTHWMNLSTEEMEFRDLATPWIRAPDNWVLRINSRTLVMHQSGHFQSSSRLVDVRSPTAAALAKVLRPVESAWYLHATLHGNGRLHVSLPRLGIDFSNNNSGELESRQFRGYVIDTNQSLGTLIGLSNRLLLAQTESLVTKSRRKVLIPYGRMKHQTLNHHVSVSIETDASRKISFFDYEIDDKLRRLAGNGSLSSRLFKICLNALTSNCLPDPFTLQTGREEALYEFRSAAMWSFLEVTQRDIDLLQVLAKLTPQRAYYPQPLKVMQKIIWDKNLPMLSQSEEYRFIIDEYLADKSRLSPFSENTEPFTAPSLPSTAIDLGQRALYQEKFLRAPQELMSPSPSDTIYDARDKQGSSTESLVCNFSNKAFHWEETLPTCKRLMGALKAVPGGILEYPGANLDLTFGFSAGCFRYSMTDTWTFLYEKFRTSSRGSDVFKIIFVLCSLAFSEANFSSDMLWTLLALSTSRKHRSTLCTRPLPQVASRDRYNLSQGSELVVHTLKNTIKSNAISFQDSPEFPRDDSQNDFERSLEEARQRYRNRVDLEVSYVVNFYRVQWPCSSESIVHLSSTLRCPHIQIIDIRGKIESMFDDWYQNRLLDGHISDIQVALNDSRYHSIQDMPAFEFPRIPWKSHSTKESIASVAFKVGDASQLVCQPPPSPTLQCLHRVERNSDNRTNGIDSVESLLADFRKAMSTDGFEYRYASDIEKSIMAFRAENKTFQQFDYIPCNMAMDELSKYWEDCKIYGTELFTEIEIQLSDPAHQVMGSQHLLAAGLWPRVTPSSLLRLLNNISILGVWKQALLHYGDAITRHQYAERLYNAATCPETGQFSSEASYFQPRGWRLDQFPDWLLLEIESNISIRPQQHQVALQMLGMSDNPESIALQLNMGEGKSSVIAPAVAAVLANGLKLVRVLVLKPLAHQSFQLLVRKLGDLINRRIYYLPFSRSIDMDISTAEKIRTIFEECKNNRGVLLVQPEHILSFKLMGLEKLCSGTECQKLSQQLISTQQWLEENARDVLDESDELLHTRYQLIYSLGSQIALEHSPLRWKIIQELFDLISSKIKDAANRYPKGFEVSTTDRPPGSFPTVRILEPAAGEVLMSAIVDDIFGDRLESVPLRLFSDSLQSQCRRFIVDRDVSGQDADLLLNNRMIEGNLAIKASILLLRGLISQNVLGSCLQLRRWRVDYGLAPERTMLAVPYRGKDNPSPRSEYSHPDCAIILTCLSYYYSGLTDHQLVHCFKLLDKMDNPAQTYESWIGGWDVPTSLRSLKGLNVEDTKHLKQDVFPIFRYNKALIDFYMSMVVFPREAKEFQHKLSTSGWDLAEERRHITTGFSGTNDSRYLLPLSIRQHDLKGHAGTNAKVLAFLLQPENDWYDCVSGADGERLMDSALLQKIVDIHQAKGMKFRVIIDVGAQFLNSANAEVAEMWLRLLPDQDIEAAVFFDDNDILRVKTRDGGHDLLQVSPYAKQLDRCVIFLDQVHSRGTDLNFPMGSRAVITLGPKLTKDTLVQACMRMRKLGLRNGHTVSFLAPPEVDRSIQKRTGRVKNGSQGVVHWALAETCASTTQAIAQWAMQGLAYQARRSAWENYRTNNDSNTLGHKIVESESQSLMELYGVLSNRVSPFDAAENLTHSRQNEVQAIRKHYFNFTPDTDALHCSRQQEEQERELSHEGEREQQVERPPKAKPATHGLDPAVLNFVVSGDVDLRSKAFLKAFDSLKDTSAGGFCVSGWSRKFLVTYDFTSTIMRGPERYGNIMDEYVRSVNFVLSSKTGYLVIVSPYEANELLPIIRKTSIVRLHNFAPKVNKNMQTLEELRLCTVGNRKLPADFPSLLSKMELCLFSGQLCFNDYQQYRDYCSHLGILQDLGKTVEDGNLTADGFVDRNERVRLGMDWSPFEVSPVAFLSELVAIRRKRMDASKSHLGRVLRARLLHEDDFRGNCS